MHFILSFWFFVQVVSASPFDLFPHHPERAFAHGYAIVLAAGDGVTVDDITDVMRHESSGWSDARPGKPCARRDAEGKCHRGPPRHWPHRAELFPKQRHYICGVMQMTAMSAAECVSWEHDLVLAYRRGADAIRGWRSFCRKIGRRGDRAIRCADVGYASGVRAARLAS